MEFPIYVMNGTHRCHTGASISKVRRRRLGGLDAAQHPLWMSSMNDAYQWAPLADAIFACRQRMPSTDAIRQLVPSTDATRRSHPRVQSSSGASRGHPRTPSTNAIHGCHPHLPSIRRCHLMLFADAVHRCHPRMPSAAAIQVCHRLFAFSMDTIRRYRAWMASTDAHERMALTDETVSCPVVRRARILPLSSVLQLRSNVLRVSFCAPAD